MCVYIYDANVKIHEKTTNQTKEKLNIKLNSQQVVL